MAHAQPTLGKCVKECGGAKTELHENDDTWEVKKADRGWTWAPCVDWGRRAPFYPPPPPAELLPKGTGSGQTQD